MFPGRPEPPVAAVAVVEIVASQVRTTPHPSLLGILLITGFIAAAIGSRKGRGFTSFLVGVLLGPIGILLAIIAKPNAPKVAREAEELHGELGEVRCVACYSWIDARATVCPVCRSEQRHGTVSEGTDAAS